MSEPVVEIVVTATRRLDRLIDAPLAVQVVSADDIRERGIRDAFDLQRQSPSLITPETGNVEVLFRLRGLGTSDYNPAAPPIVAFYSDDLFINSTVALLGAFYDADRVEILKGPQGTLWGKNTTAGVVQLVNKRPTNDLEGYAFTEFGDYGRKKFEGALSGPIVEDKLAARISFVKSSFDGYITDARRGGQTGGSDWAAERVQLAWSPSEQTKLWLKYEHQHQQADLRNTFEGILPGGTDVFGYAGYGSPFVGAYFPQPKTDLKTETVSAAVTHAFANGIELTNIAGSIKSVAYPYYNNGSSPNLIQAGLGYTQSDQYSDELRLASPTDGRFNWIVGGFFMKQNMNVFGLYGTAFALNDPLGGLKAGYTLESKSAAGFVSGTYNLTDRLELSAGLRYTHDHLSTHASSYFGTLDPVDILNPNLFTGAVQYFDGRAAVSNNEPTADITLAYEVRHNINTYAKVSRGYRASTINNIVTPGQSISITKPEKLMAYEIGAKGAWGRFLAADAAVFYYDFSNKQVFQNLGTLASSLADTTVKIKGIEFNMTVRPTDGWLLGAAATWLDSRYGSFPNAIVSTALDVTGVTNLDGKPIPGAPDLTSVLFTQYEWDSPLGRLKLRTDWQYRSSQFFVDEFANVKDFNYPPGVVPELVAKAATEGSIWIGDVSLSLSPSEHFEIAGYVRNVENVYYQVGSNFFGIGRSFSNAYAPPRTYGLTLQYNF